MDWLDGLGVGAAEIHDHAHGLQRRFADGLGAADLPGLGAERLVVPLDRPERGNFLTFRTPEAGRIHDALLQRNVITDYRGERLRIGFGVYHDDGDVDRLLAALADALK
jgi:selenocysteine lyase/cysteine desulfurase